MAVVPLAVWSAETSQQLQVPVTTAGALTIDVAVVDAPIVNTGARRRSLVMPNPTLDSYGRPEDWQPSSATDTAWGYLQVVIDGKDRTWFRGTHAQVVSWESGEPFGDSVCVIGFPQITPFDVVGSGALYWLRAGAHVQIRNINGSTRTVLWTGMLVSGDEDDTQTEAGYTAHAVGPLFQADLSIKMPGFHLDERDIGTVIAETLNEVPSRDYLPVRAVTTGIMTRQRGSGTSRLTGYVQDLLGTATVSDGSNQWTLTQRAWAGTIRLKDRTTVHATVTAGQPGLEMHLSLDNTQAPNVIYGEGVAPDGSSWRNAKYPNLHPDDAPLYPLSPGSVFNPGSGTGGFGPFATEMRENGYNIHSGSTYDSRDEDEVRDAQARAGILVDGIVGPQTWAAIFAVGSNGGSLSGAFYAPLAVDPRVEPYLYNAQGGRIGNNPSYEPARLRVERFENFGEGVSKAQAVKSARAELHRIGSPKWVGTVTLHADPEQMSRWNLAAGMNLLVKHHRGANRMLHIAGVASNWNLGSVDLQVDEGARDLLTLGAIISRNKDAATDPLRRTSSQRRQSRNTRDTVVPFDSESGAGIIPKHALYGGLWTVIRIPAGQVGNIARTIITTNGPATAFAVGVFSKPITANRLVRLVGNPLSGSKPWSPEADALYDAGLLMAWGGSDEPAGYYPSTKSDGGSVTGRLIDDAGWYYESTNPPWVWVAEFSGTSCFIEGRLWASPDGL